MRGIRQYYNRWRVYIVDNNGNTHNLYVDSELEAKAYIEEIGPRSRCCFNKRVTAKHQDLPVGLYQGTHSKRNRHGELKKYSYIGTRITINGKASVVTRYIGRKTREQCVKEIAKIRKKLLKQKIKLEGTR